MRATHKQLKAALGIASDDAVTSRVRDALTAGAIERTNPEAARSAGARYRVKVGSADLKASAGVPVFPLPASVEKLMNDPVKLAEAQAALAKEQAEERAARAAAAAEKGETLTDDNEDATSTRAMGPRSKKEIRRKSRVYLNFEKKRRVFFFWGGIWRVNGVTG